MDTKSLISDASIVSLAQAIVRSYKLKVGRDLLSSVGLFSIEEAAKQLYELPSIVLSHDGGDSPTFTFANMAAQELFEYSWEKFLTIRSHQSAEPDQREARAEMLQRAAEQGFIDDYCGIRITRSGKRFEIRNATIWNVVDEDDKTVGQAAVFDDWNYLTG